MKLLPRYLLVFLTSVILLQPYRLASKTRAGGDSAKQMRIPAVLAQTAELELSAGNYDAALKHYELVKSWSPAVAEAAIHRCLAAGAFPTVNAMQRFSMRSDSEPSTGGSSVVSIASGPPRLFAAADPVDDLLHRGNHEGAAKLCKLLLKSNPDDFSALVRLGMAKGKVGQHEEALAAYKKASKLQPQNAFVLASMGAVKYNRGAMKAAILDLNAALALEPDNALALRFRGACAAMSKGSRPRDAVVDLDAALRLQPGNSFALAHRGVAKQLLGDGRGALADFEAALASDAVNELALQHRASARLQRMDYQGAADDCTILVSYGSRDAAVLRTRATARLRMAQYQEALEDCDAAAWSSPQSIYAMLPVRAECKYKLGNYKGAKADAKTLLKWDPTHELALRLMSDERVKTAGRTFQWFL